MEELAHDGYCLGFSDSSAGKESTCNAGDTQILFRENIFPSSKYISLSSGLTFDMHMTRWRCCRDRGNTWWLWGSPLPTSVWLAAERPEATHDGQSGPHFLCDWWSEFIFVCTMWSPFWAVLYGPEPILILPFFFFFPSFSTVTIYDAFNVVNY